METGNYTVITLAPTLEDGYLTNAGEIDIKQRLFAKKIYLAVNDSASNYKEITADEYATLKAEQDAAIKAEQDAAIKAEEEANQPK